MARDYGTCICCGDSLEYDPDYHVIYDDDTVCTNCFSEFWELHSKKLKKSYDAFKLQKNLQRK